MKYACMKCGSDVFERDGYFFHDGVQKPPFHAVEVGTVQSENGPVKVLAKVEKSLEERLRVEIASAVHAVSIEFHKEISRLEDAIRRLGGTPPPRNGS